jgi:hypothetical protein
MLRFSAALLLAAAAPALAAIAAPEHPLATLRPAHPRLIATAGEFTRLQSLVRTDPCRSRRWCTG